MHSVPFGATDPVFHLDFSFFVFTLPAIDDFMGLLWGGVILGVLGSIAMAVVAITVMNAPEELPLPLEPPPGRSPEDALRVAVITGGDRARGHLRARRGRGSLRRLSPRDEQHALGQRHAVRRSRRHPARGDPAGARIPAGARRSSSRSRPWCSWPSAGGAHRPAPRSRSGRCSAAGCCVAGLTQGVPAAVYQATSVGPNEQTAQTPTIGDFLTTSRYAWAIESTGTEPAGGEPQLRHAPSRRRSATSSPTSGTLQNVRIQDPTQLPDTLAQVDRSRSYQTYSTITVDRYPDAGDRRRRRGDARPARDRGG